MWFFHGLLYVGYDHDNDGGSMIFWSLRFFFPFLPFIPEDGCLWGDDRGGETAVQLQKSGETDRDQLVLMLLIYRCHVSTTLLFHSSDPDFHDSPHASVFYSEHLED